MTRQGRGVRQAFVYSMMRERAGERLAEAEFG